MTDIPTPPMSSRDIASSGLELSPSPSDSRCRDLQTRSRARTRDTLDWDASQARKASHSTHWDSNHIISEYM
jgi:hypothetical protein